MLAHGHPRDLPAASLKRVTACSGETAGFPSPSSAGLTRGLIEANVESQSAHSRKRSASSAGLTRGLIEAWLSARGLSRHGFDRHPRDLPAASLKQWASPAVSADVPAALSSAGLTRGLIEAQSGGHAGWRTHRVPGHPRDLPAASLKLAEVAGRATLCRVIRGTYPRPH